MKVYRKYRVEALVTRREYYSTVMHADSLGNVVAEVMSTYSPERVAKIFIQPNPDGLVLGRLLTSDFRVD